MPNLLQDLKYGFRSLRRTPLTLIVTVLSLGLGIGAATSVFSVVNAFLFRPSGYAEPESLVALYTSRDDGKLYGKTSFADYSDLLEAVAALEDAAAFGYDALKLGDETSSQILVTEVVSGSYFSVLGVRPVTGRGFLPAETEVGKAERVVVISHDLWLRRFAGDPSVVGRTIRLGARAFTVVGVAPDALASRKPALRTDVWIPLGVAGVSDRHDAAKLARRESRGYTVIGRLREDATREQLEAQLAVVGKRLHQEYSEEWQDDRGEARVFSALSERESRLNPDARGVFWVLSSFFLGATGLILLIACSNVASLFLARAHQRRRETAVRTALGASRRRLLGMFLAESLLPGLAGGVLGIAVAWIATRAMSSVSLPIAVPIHFDFGLDGRVLGFALVLGLVSSLVFGLAPALAGTGGNLLPSLKSDSTGGSGSRRFGLRNLLVSAQVAACLILLVGAGLFIRSLEGAATMDLGFRTERIAVMSKALPGDLRGDVARGDEADRTAGSRYVRDLVAHLAAQPEVEDAQAAQGVELTMLSGGAAAVSVSGYQPGAEESLQVHFNRVTPGYLEMLAVPLRAGRTLRASDSEGAPRVAVINESFAARYWPGKEAIGRRFTADDRQGPGVDNDGTPRTYEVVGVARDGKVVDVDDPPMPYFWASLYQDPAPRFSLLLKGSDSAEAMLPVLRREVEIAEGEVTMVPPGTLADMVDIQFLHLRLAARILGWGGLFGLVLAVIGIYGVVAFAVTQRTREIAIRVAIGAQRGQVLRQIARQGLTLAAAGLLVGLAVILPLARLLRSQLFEMSPADPVAVGGGAGILLLAALVASFVPASRATRIEPIRALREE